MEKNIHTPQYLQWYNDAENRIKGFVVSDGSEPYDNKFFAPGIERAQLNEVRGSDTDYFVLPYNVLVLQLAQKTILVDVGNGTSYNVETGLLVKHLQAIGIDAESVTDIVVSHTHTDHINGLWKKDRMSTFPHAVVHIAEAEYEFWQKRKPQDVERLRNKTSFYQSGKLLLDCLVPIAAPGHTPGHHIFAVRLGDKSFLHMADICHDAVMLFRKPEWGTTFDSDFELAVKTRKEVLNNLAEFGQLAFGYHMPWPGFGYVVREGESFAWKQV